MKWLSIIMQNSLLSLRLQVKFLKKFVKSLFFFICFHQFSENMGFKRSILEISPCVEVWKEKQSISFIRKQKSSVVKGHKQRGKHAVSLFLLSKFVWAWLPPRLGRGKNIIAFGPCWFLLPRAEYFFFASFKNKLWKMQPSDFACTPPAALFYVKGVYCGWCSWVLLYRNI